MSNHPKRRRAIALTSAGLLAVGAFAVTTSSALADPANSDENPTAEVLGIEHPEKIDGKYLVSLSSELSTTNLGHLLEDYDATVTSEWGSFNAFATELTYAEAQQLAADPLVEYVQQDAVVETQEEGTQTDPPSWGLDRIDQVDLPLDDEFTYANTASDVTIHVLDTGVNLNHNEFDGRLVEGFDAIDEGGDADDCQGHGTHVAGTAAGTEFGVAKEAKIAPIRVLDCGGTGSYEGIIEGINWVTENAEGPTVANMSLGGPSDQAVDDAVSAAIDSGVTVIAASGNDATDACNYSPASVESAITVNNSNIDDGQSNTSNYGSCTDLYAPGSDITSAWIDGDDAEYTDSGTSMAAPHVAGAAAIYLQENPEATPAEVKDHLLETATEDAITNPGPDTPNLLLFHG